jgi:hypothetical protein
MQKESRFILIVITMLIIIGILFILILVNVNKLSVLQREIIPVKMTVGDHRGIDVNISVLSFGNVTSGSYGSRNISIGNDFDFPVQYEFTSEGDISEFLIIPRVVYLDVGETKPVTFKTIWITNEPKGDYSGNIIVKVRKRIN